jgi:hypothetical protein
MMSLRLSFVACLAVAAVACGSESSVSSFTSAEDAGAASDDADAGNDAARPAHAAENLGAIPAVFAPYCVGTLRVERKLLLPRGTTFTQFDPLVAPPGTRFLVASLNDDDYFGFVFRADGTPVELEIDVVAAGNNLVAGRDFDSDCVAQPIMFDPRERAVLLADATFHERTILTGASCKLPAGTVLEPGAGGNVDRMVAIRSPTIKAACNLDVGYTSDALVGTLFLRTL